MPFAGIGDSFDSFFDAVGNFAENIAAVNWGPLLIGCTVFVGYLSLRARAYYNIVRAAYPNERIEFSRIWGAYLAAYGFNNVVPARGGDVIHLASGQYGTFDGASKSSMVTIKADAGVQASIAADRKPPKLPPPPAPPVAVAPESAAAPVTQ